MSIQAEVDLHVNAGRLIRLGLFYPGPEKRKLYVSPEIKALLDGPWSGDEKWEKRWSRARQQFDDFIDGLPRDRIFVRSAPRARSTCFMSQLEPECDEVWEIRCRDPKPGLRIFGSFVAQDVFVALTALPRECIGGEEDWDRAIQQYKEEWSKYFTLEPFSGVYPDDYLTNAFILD